MKMFIEDIVRSFKKYLGLDIEIWALSAYKL